MLALGAVILCLLTPRSSPHRLRPLAWALLSILAHALSMH
jgi:hypothetical protein